MSIKIDLTASDVDKQMEVLKHFPELAEKHYRPVVTRDAAALRASIQPQIPIRSGRAAKTFGSKVTGRGFSLKGQVGWYDKSDPWYINIVEYGARPHPLSSGASIRSKKKFSLFQKYANDPNRIRMGGTPVNVNGNWVTIEIHPGFSARGFMAAGYSAMQPIIENDLAMANERIIADLAAI